MALGRSPDFAINHDKCALAIHAVNHPDTIHLSRNLWQVDPIDVVGQRGHIGLAWFSPDCRHHSRARGGRPTSKSVRDLAWIVVSWARRVMINTIIIENVAEFVSWGPVNSETGLPIVEREGETFQRWCKALRQLGYKIEWRLLRAADYGAPTSRTRVFIICRRDGKPIVWPEPTHGDPESEDVKSGRLKPWRTAASIIDWSIPCPSIFDSSEEIFQRYGVRARRPLADATLRRIAQGVHRYVLNAKAPFIVPAAWGGPTAKVAGTMVQTGWGERRNQAPRALDLHKPIGTQVAGGAKHGVVAAFLSQANTGMVGHHALEPVSTITAKGSHQNLVMASMLTLRGSDRRDGAVTEPVKTISAGGNHQAVVAAFLTKFFGTGISVPVDRPLDTVTTKDRCGLVTVTVEGEPYYIADIGMRMLTIEERMAAQSFPADYEIHRGRLPDGEEIELTGADKSRLIGNSVCPVVAAALVRANVPDLAETSMAA